MWETLMLIGFAALVWSGYRALFRWMDVRDELRIWGLPMKKVGSAHAESSRRGSDRVAG